VRETKNATRKSGFASQDGECEKGKMRKAADVEVVMKSWQPKRYDVARLPWHVPVR
jgi:hypothetical protein